MRKHLWALLAVAFVFIAPAANAACPYTGNTSGVDSSAILSALNDICSTPYAATAVASLTRPNNTTTYTVSTGWANATSGATYGTLSNVCSANGKHVYITDISVVDEANQTLKLQGTLFLFSAAPTAISDNATFSVASADWPNLKAPQSFTLATIVNQTSGSGGAVMTDIPANIEIGCAGGDRNLYFMVRVDNAYVPLASEVLDVRVKVVGLN